jgi:hypothetical protein
MQNVLQHTAQNTSRMKKEEAEEPQDVMDVANLLDLLFLLFLGLRRNVSTRGSCRRGETRESKRRPQTQPGRPISSPCSANPLLIAPRRSSLALHGFSPSFHFPDNAPFQFLPAAKRVRRKAAVCPIQDCLPHPLLTVYNSVRRLWLPPRTCI